MRCLRLQSFPTCSASYLAFSTAKEFLLGQRSGMALSQRAASVTGSAAARSGGKLWLPNGPCRQQHFS